MPSSRSRVSDLKDVIDDKEVYVIGHKSPDSDSVCSAIALAHLINSLGGNAIAASSERVNKESACALKELNVPSPVIISDAADKRFFLVDHSSYVHAIEHMQEAEIIGIIDHHEEGDIVKDKSPFYINEKIGAVCTLIYELYKEYKVPIDKSTAGVLLTGVLSDTNNMVSKVTDADTEAYKELVYISQIIDINLFYRKMRDAYLDYSDMTPLEVLLNNNKEYEENGIRFLVSVVSAKSEEEQKRLCHLLNETLEENFEDLHVDMAFVKVENSEKNNMYMFGFGLNAQDILQSFCDDCDGSYYYFKKNLSRKNKIVPEIRKHINPNL